MDLLLAALLSVRRNLFNANATSRRLLNGSQRCLRRVDKQSPSIAVSDIQPHVPKRYLWRYMFFAFQTRLPTFKSLGYFHSVDHVPFKTSTGHTGSQNTDSRWKQRLEDSSGRSGVSREPPISSLGCATLAESASLGGQNCRLTTF